MADEKHQQAPRIPISKKKVLLWGWILLLCGLLRVIFFVQHINAPVAINDDQVIEVRAGMTFNQLVNQLASQDILDYPFDVRLYGRLSGRANAIQAGDYLLTPGMTATGLLDKLASGDVIVYQVVLLEGWTLAQALQAIQAHPMITVELPANDPSALQSLLGSESYPEGMIFPDTYNFSRGTTDRQILQRAFTLMQSMLSEEWAARDVGLPYEEPYEALVMASIVEKETGLASERQQIAGVFVRRLQRNMRLQTDPTVIYGLGSDFTGDLTRADLRRRTPYNTYMNAGLPPTPIALPGRESLYASLHPDEGDTLYFVARGDGSHYFSSTLEEHERAVQQYQLGGQ